MEMEQSILSRPAAHNQKHLVEHYHRIKDPALKARYLNQLAAIDYDQAAQLFQHVYLDSKQHHEEVKIDFSPVENVATVQDILQHSQQLDFIGYKSLAAGEAAVCIMSGGQGTRLGFDHPKGMFDLGLKCQLSLFGFFAKRLLRLNQLVCQRQSIQQKCCIKWYMMTSDINHQQIVAYFKSNNYFGYDPVNIIFFAQGGLPALDYHSKVLLESEGQVSLAPGGNGAIFTQMRQKGVIEHMKANGVKYIYLGPVDNVLLKLADPTSLGYLIKNDFEIVSHYLKKRSADEKVGLHVKVNDKIKVCEYSELSQQVKEMKNANGEYVFSHGTRASMYITREFIDRITSDNELMASINKRYHLAEKKIKHYDVESGEIVKPAQNNGVKFELFYFDVFEETEKIGLFETVREDEFAPLKNADGEDSPASARSYLRALHRSWLIKAGLELEGEGHVEIAPNVTYNGEGLREYVLAKYGSIKISLPAYIE